MVALGLQAVSGRQCRDYIEAVLVMMEGMDLLFHQSLLEWQGLWELLWESVLFGHWLEYLGENTVLHLLPGWLHPHQGDVPASLGDLALLPWDNLYGPLWHRAVKSCHICSTPYHGPGSCPGNGNSYTGDTWDRPGGHLVYGTHWEGHCTQGIELCMAILLSLLEHVTAGLQGLALWEEGLIV